MRYKSLLGASLVLAVALMATAVACSTRRPNFSEQQALQFAAGEICSGNPETVLPELTAEVRQGKWFITWSTESGTGLFSVGTSNSGNPFLADEDVEGTRLKFGQGLSPECTGLPPAPAIATALERGLNLTPEPAEELTESDLQRALLNEEDLPVGWEVQETADSSIEPSDSCGISQSVRTGRLTTALAVYRAGDLGPYLAQSVMAFSQGGAAQVMASLEEAISSCEGWVGDEGLITESSWSVSMQNAPGLGEQAVAVQAIGVATKTVEHQRYTVDTLYIRHGDLISSLAYIVVNDEGRNASQLSSLAVVVDERLTQLLD